MKKIACLLLSFTLLLASAAHAADAQALQPISSLDVPRYLGRWYEIAKFPNWFQKQCVSDTAADYQLVDGQRLSVSNRCRKADGEMAEALGLARQIGGPTSAKLKVRFAPSWLSFLPLVWGDYWVVDLDPSYQLVAVSEPKREYLWILSRTPQVDAERYKALIERLQGLGLDTTKLEPTRHSTASR